MEHNGIMRFVARAVMACGGVVIRKAFVARVVIRKAFLARVVIRKAFVARAVIRNAFVARVVIRKIKPVGSKPV